MTGSDIEESKSAAGRWPLLRHGESADESDDDEIGLRSRSKHENHVKFRRNGRRKIGRGLFLALIYGLGIISGLLLFSDRPVTLLEKVGVKQPQNRQFAPSMPTKSIIFEDDLVLKERPNPESNKAWDALIPTAKKGGGYVNITNPRDYGLDLGIYTTDGKEIFAVSMFHQLHCLSLIRDQYWRLLDGIAGLYEDQKAWEEELDWLMTDDHTKHCFSYIAQGISCAGDTSIEWARRDDKGKPYTVDGWGIPHTCKDPKAIFEWVEANAAPVIPARKDINSHEGHHHHA